ncbi:MAG TPA: AraC family transcriptional regulator [Ilumatobacter sp.]|nr:AraC family transcriptional regulator [Ilumatobacter sp.]
MIYFAQRVIEQAHTFPLHRHVDHELLWLRHGSLVVRRGTQIWRATPRFAVVVPAGLDHDAVVSGSTVFREIYIEPVDEDPLSVGTPFLVAMSPAVRRVLDDLEGGLTDGGARAHLERALVHLLRAAEHMPQLAAPAMPVDERARHAAQLVLDDPRTRLRLAEIAAPVGASSRTLTRLFVAETGMSFAAWRTAALSSEATRLLGDGHSSGSVATKVGYRDASAFSRAFRVATGHRPSDVRVGQTDRRQRPPRSRHVLDASGWRRTEL